MQIIKVDPDSGEIVCSIQVPAFGPSNLAFGECPNSKDGKLNCIYLTTGRAIGLSGAPLTENDGALFLIENSGSEGILPYKVEYDQLISNNGYESHSSLLIHEHVS